MITRGCFSRDFNHGRFSVGAFSPKYDAREYRATVQSMSPRQFNVKRAVWYRFLRSSAQQLDKVREALNVIIGERL